MFGQTDIENLFLKRSGVIYNTTNKKKNIPPEFTEFLLVLHGILLLTHHPVSTDDTVFSTNWTSVMDHLQMFLMNDSTIEDVQAAGRVLVAHRYSYNDKPLNVSARKELYVTKGNNKVTSKLVTLATVPQLKMLRTYTNCVPITPLRIGWETQCCMAVRRFKENSTAFIHPQASTGVPDGDKAAQLPDQQMRSNKCPCVREDDFC